MALAFDCATKSSRSVRDRAIRPICAQPQSDLVRLTVFSSYLSFADFREANFQVTSPTWSSAEPCASGDSRFHSTAPPNGSLASLLAVATLTTLRATVRCDRTGVIVAKSLVLSQLALPFRVRAHYVWANNFKVCNF